MRHAFKKANEVALKVRDRALRVEHVVYGILTTDNIIKEIIYKKIIAYDTMLNEIMDHMKIISTDEDPADDQIIKPESLLTQLIRKCSINKNNDSITVDVFFIECFTLNIKIMEILKDYGGITETFIDKKIKQLVPMANVFPMDENSEKNKSKPNTEVKSKTPILDNFSRDLTVLAASGKIDPVIGREAEIERIAQILTRRKKNNPILLGSGGVGKTAIVEGLALRIINNDCPRPLLNKRVVSLDLTLMVAGTKYRGVFEERIKSIMDELKDNTDIILFIDELHTMIGAGNSSGSMDVSNILKPALARGEVQCIGATTLDEYRLHIEKDGALDRRFQKVMVLPPNLEETKEILIQIKSKYESYHKVEYTDDSINEIVRLADRYITNREFPDKALDIMDEAGSRTQLNVKVPEKIKKIQEKIRLIKQEKEVVLKTQNFEKAVDLRDKEKKLISEVEAETEKWNKSILVDKKIITPDIIAEVVASITNIPVDRISNDELKKIKNIENLLSSRVIGQDNAISVVSSAIKRNKTGINKKNKPIASFFFLGESGVGKCILSNSIISIRNKLTNKIERISILDFINNTLTKPN